METIECGNLQCQVLTNQKYLLRVHGNSTVVHDHNAEVVVTLIYSFMRCVHPLTCEHLTM